MATPFSFAGTLSYPMDTGLEPTQIPVNFAGYFDSEAKATLKLTGAGTQSVDFSTITTAGAKLLLVEYDADPSPTAQAVQLQFNGGGTSGEVELTQGGFLVYGNTAPSSSGVLSLDIVHAASATIRVHVLG